MILLAIGTAYLLAAFWLDRHGRRPPEGEFDAIVVAGCRVMPGGEPSPALAHRVRVAVQLWTDQVAPVIVFTGGVGDESPSEAEAAARFAEARGVPRSAMRLEQESTSTEENARLAAQLIGSDRRIVVVSSAYHVFRCEHVFGRHFAHVDGFGAIEAASPRIRGALREVTAVFAYGLLGRL